MLSKQNMIPALLALLISACTNGSPTEILSPAKLPEQVVLPYSFRNKAFDGQNLWQVAKEDESYFLIKQNLLGKMLNRLQISDKLPAHHSLAWGKEQLWLLDFNNTIHPISSIGKAQASIKLIDLPESKIAEQLIWVQDELWVLTAAYLLSDGTLAPSRIYQIDSTTGKNLKTLNLQENEALTKIPRSRFDNFAHQNLSLDSEAFYIARANIFEKGQNGIYRIERSSGLISYRPLERIYTGLNSVFWWNNQLYGIELIDSNNCADFCRGKLEKL